MGILKGNNNISIIPRNKKSLFGKKGELLTSLSVTPIRTSYKPIKSKDQIKKLVEAPLVSACEILFDKNILTRESSANGTNIYLEIYYDLLLEKNKDIVKQLGGKISASGHTAFRPVVRFELPPIEAPVDYIIQWGEWIANTMVEQKIHVKRPSYSEIEFAKYVACDEDFSIDKFNNDNSFKYMGLRGIYMYSTMQKRFVLKNVL